MTRRAEQQLKTLSTCVDRQRVEAIQLPDGAATIESVTLQLTDASENEITEPLDELKVTERENLKFRLVGQCYDSEQNDLGELALPDAQVLLQVVDLEREFTRGVLVGGTPCPSTVMKATGEHTQFTLEVGERSIFTELDNLGEPEFAAIELLAARTKVEFKDSEGEWHLLDDRAFVNLEPKHEQPAEIRWWGYTETAVEHTMPLSFAGQHDVTPHQHYLYVSGPSFHLLDEFGNVVVQWGKDDTEWHRDVANDLVLLRDPSGGEAGAEGTPPWAVILFDHQDNTFYYRTREFISGLFGDPPQARRALSRTGRSAHGRQQVLHRSASASPSTTSRS